jgi:hypothetical protein
VAVVGVQVDKHRGGIAVKGSCGFFSLFNHGPLAFEKKGLDHVPTIDAKPKEQPGHFPVGPAANLAIPPPFFENMRPHFEGINDGLEVAVPDEFPVSGGEEKQKSLCQQHQDLQKSAKQQDMLRVLGDHQQVVPIYEVTGKGAPSSMEFR